LGCVPTDTMRGVRMQAEQSRVGKVLSNWAMCPPIEGSRSTMYDRKPASAISSAAWMPAIPPPTTRVASWMGTCSGSSGSWWRRAQRRRRVPLSIFPWQPLCRCAPRRPARGSKPVRTGRGSIRLCCRHCGRCFRAGAVSRQQRPPGSGPFLDILLDQLLSQAGAHEFVIAGDNHSALFQLFAGPVTATSSTSTMPAILLPQ
jgi:hypothetical protein